MRGMERSGHASVNLLVNLCADHAFGDSEIEIGLKSEPKLGRNTEVYTQSQHSVGSDSTFPVHNSANAAGWNSDFPGESIDADVHWLHELLEENLSRMDRVKQFFTRHGSSLRFPLREVQLNYIAGTEHVDGVDNLRLASPNLGQLVVGSTRIASRRPARFRW